jgi:RNA polymerase sigma-70 factor (ECF subfamily)
MVDERALIERSRRKDPLAFEQLVALKREKAVRVAWNIVGDLDDAREVAQMAFIKLWSVIDRFEIGAPFDPWFSRIVVNQAIDHCRKRRRIAWREENAPGRLPPEVIPGADAELMRAELRKILDELASELGPVQRAVFTLKEIEGESTETIAAILDIKTSTVRNHLMQARRRIREGLERRYPEYFRRPRR